jgi:cbb3-type cytochrome oxidase maturation protein
MGFPYLVPIALALGALGLTTFMWTFWTGQHENLDWLPSDPV